MAELEKRVEELEAEADKALEREAKYTSQLNELIRRYGSLQDDYVLMAKHLTALFEVALRVLANNSDKNDGKSQETIH